MDDDGEDSLVLHVRGTMQTLINEISQQMDFMPVDGEVHNVCEGIISLCEALERSLDVLFGEQELMDLSWPQRFEDV